MAVSKAWNWEEEKSHYWLKPCEESCYLAQRWKESGAGKILDLGSGLGRHAVFFAKQGFEVSACDLSAYGINHLNNWAAREGLHIETAVADMLSLPYEDGSFDWVFSYLVISHTDSKGIVKIIGEIERVLRPGGEIFLTLGSKETWSFRDAGYPQIDENTVIKTEEGSEKGVPHFYIDLPGILKLMSGFAIERVRHIDDCYHDGEARNSKHYHITAAKK